jgi:hypothetical protein
MGKTDRESGSHRGETNLAREIKTTHTASYCRLHAKGDPRPTSRSQTHSSDCNQTGFFQRSTDSPDIGFPRSLPLRDAYVSH